MRESEIAAVIERDILRTDDTGTKTDVVACWSCGHSYRYRGRSSDVNGNFCSARCQAWFDAGNPSHEQPTMRAMVGPRQGKHGFHINCSHCRKEFESKGLRCCSVECERRYRERHDNIVVMAEVGDAPKEKRRCVQCGGTIPVWRNGKKVSRSARFCSDRCRNQAWRSNAKIAA